MCSLQTKLFHWVLVIERSDYLAITSFIGIDEEEDKDVFITGSDESDNDLLLYESGYSGFL